MENDYQQLALLTSVITQLYSSRKLLFVNIVCFIHCLFMIKHWEILMESNTETKKLPAIIIFGITKLLK